MTDETEAVTEETVVPGETEAVAAGSENAAPSGLEALGALKEEQEVTVVREPKLDAYGRAYATGKRKNAIARVWIKPGAGRITVNGREVETYFARPVLRMLIGQPFDVAERVDAFDVVCTVTGGGLSGQAGAIRHGIARALVKFEPELRKNLKIKGHHPRDKT